MSLSPELMKALLGAIASSAGKPNREEIEKSLHQLAEAAAAICKAVGSGTADNFLMQFQQALERRPAVGGIPYAGDGEG